VVVCQTGDCFARYLVRVEEIKQSARIINQLIDRIPTGPFNPTDAAKITQPGKANIYGSIEGVIENFELMMWNKGWKVPIGEGYFPFESPNGELGYFIVGDGTNAADLDQAITVLTATVYYVIVRHIGEFTLKVGTSRGGTEMVDTVVPYSDPDDDYITSEVPFTAITTTAHLRFENSTASPIYLDSVQCAGSTEALTTGVQALLRVPAATITQTWTARSELSIQPTGGAIKLSGVQASTSYANDAAAAAGGVAVGQVYRNGSVVQVRIV
jgi:hypothetical protein